MISFKKQTKIQKFIYILKNYLTYTNIKLNLQRYPYINSYILKEISMIIKDIKISETFTLINILTNLINILEYFIIKLTNLKNYDILNSVEYIIFYIQYLIDRYYYKYNDFYFIYKCANSINYYSLCCKYFINRDYKGIDKPHIFSYILYISFFGLNFIPVYYAVLRFIIERLDLLTNIVFYYANLILPI